MVSETSTWPFDSGCLNMPVCQKSVERSCSDSTGGAMLFLTYGTTDEESGIPHDVPQKKHGEQEGKRLIFHHGVQHQTNSFSSISELPLPEEEEERGA